MNERELMIAYKTLSPWNNNINYDYKILDNRYLTNTPPFRSEEDLPKWDNVKGLLKNKEQLKDHFYNLMQYIVHFEVQLTNRCQNKCDYCYRIFFEKRSPLTLTPIESVKDMFTKMKQYFGYPWTLELYGGDPVLDWEHFRTIVYFLNDLFIKEHPNILIVVPTNGRTLLEMPETDVFKLIDDIPNIRFSFSTDSPYGDHLRPLSDYGVQEDFSSYDYNKMFRYFNKYPAIFGFHPMLSFKNTENWFNIWKFFIDNKAGDQLYLLEIRHPITLQQAVDGVLQLIKILEYVYTHKIKPNKHFWNIFQITNIGRGIGCSLQSTIYANINADLYTCHRLEYPRFRYGNLFTEEYDINKNYFWARTFSYKNSPMCLGCPIRNICNGMCLGAQYEVYKDVNLNFIPLCLYYNLKYYVFFKIYNINNIVNLNVLRTTLIDTFGKDVIKEIESRLYFHINYQKITNG